MLLLGDLCQLDGGISEFFFQFPGSKMIGRGRFWGLIGSLSVGGATSGVAVGTGRRGLVQPLHETGSEHTRPDHQKPSRHSVRQHVEPLKAFPHHSQHPLPVRKTNKQTINTRHKASLVRKNIKIWTAHPEFPREKAVFHTALCRYLSSRIKSPRCSACGGTAPVLKNLISCPLFVITTKTGHLIVKSWFKLPTRFFFFCFQISYST